MKTPNSSGPTSPKRGASSENVPLTSVADLGDLRARVARLSSPGFSAQPRLLFALAAREVTAFTSAARQLSELRPSLSVPRCPSLPRHVGALWFGEGLVVDVVALPLDPAFAPLWALVLPGAVALVSLRHDAASPLLARCCAEAELPHLDAKALVQPLEIGSPSCVAKLVAAAISQASTS